MKNLEQENSKINFNAFNKKIIITTLFSIVIMLSYSQEDQTIVLPTT